MKRIKIDKPIVMVGLMGAGKTSVGKLLAKKLRLPFIDSDVEIENAAGCSISDIFSLYGEAEFRRGEERVMERLLNYTAPVVLSTGEGAFISENTRDHIQKKGVSIWLKANLELLVKRTSFKDTRPLLLKDEPRKVLENLMEKRYPIYGQANITVETFDEPTENTVRKVLETLESYILN